MRLRRLLAVARKEFLHVVRDPRALGVSIALPLILLLLFGYALTLDVDRVHLAVWDQSNTPASRELTSRFDGSRYFAIAHRAESYQSIESAMNQNQILVALVIPPDFGRRVDSGRTARVQILADGSDANTATLAMAYAETIVLDHSQRLAVERMSRHGQTMPEPPVDVRPRIWFNTDLESKIYIIPGLIAVIIMLISALLTSLTVAREWETGTMEQLISTPIKASELILGKLAPYFAIGILDTVLSMLASRYLFEVPLRGNVLLLGGLSVIYILGALSLGILISTVTKAQLLASQMAFTATFLPAFLLSGFMFDIGTMPRVLQLVTYLVPARYFVTILRGLYLKGVGLPTLWPECLLLTAFATFMLVLAVRAFQKRLV